VSHKKITCARCVDFARFSEKMEPFWGLGYAHGLQYEGPIFRFCPFCGERLVLEDLPDTPFEEVEP